MSRLAIVDQSIVRSRAGGGASRPAAPLRRRLPSERSARREFEQVWRENKRYFNELSPDTHPEWRPRAPRERPTDALANPRERPFSALSAPRQRPERYPAAPGERPASAQTSGTRFSSDSIGPRPGAGRRAGGRGGSPRRSRRRPATASTVINGDFDPIEPPASRPNPPETARSRLDFALRAEAARV
jgi:hypothetical protein